MIILLLNLEVVVLIYFRDTGCFIDYYIVIINIIVTSSYSATYMYVYIYVYTHPLQLLSQQPIEIMCTNKKKLYL